MRIQSNLFVGSSNLGNDNIISAHARSENGYKF